MIYSRLLETLKPSNSSDLLFYLGCHRLTRKSFFRFQYCWCYYFENSISFLSYTCPSGISLSCSLLNLAHNTKTRSAHDLLFHLCRQWFIVSSWHFPLCRAQQSEGTKVFRITWVVPCTSSLLLGLPDDPEPSPGPHTSEARMLTTRPSGSSLMLYSVHTFALYSVFWSILQA